MESEYKKAKERYLDRLSESVTVPRRYSTVSDLPIKECYFPDDIEGKDYLSDIGFPGEYPFTRGIHTTGYRGKIWTMRQFAGFGTPEDTNQRFKYLLDKGQTGLSVAFDLPTLMGWDADAEMSRGEVGICGVSVSSLLDMEILFKDIPLDKVSTSMTINSPAAMIFAFYLAVAKKQGLRFDSLSGTLQNDILKEFIAQKEFIFPPRPSMRIIVDMIEYCSKETPKWNPISISGYHIREAGSTAVQELAFTLADGFAYIEACLERGMDIDSFAPRLSFFFNSHLDFFEEIAKFRAARRIYARRMKEVYKAKNPRSWWLRFHSQTAGCTLTAQQPENNIVRTAYQALAAVLGGTQSLHTNSMDETLALPSEKAVKIALRTQQMLAYETGVINTVDPLGGSYFIEKLTDEMEAGAEKIFQEIDALGGVIPAIEAGYFQKEIANSAYRYQLQLESKEKIIVGVNEFVDPDESIDIPILKIPPEVEIEQRKRLAELRNSRNQNDVNKALENIGNAAKDGRNLMPPLIEAAEKYVTLGEMVAELKKYFGTYTDVPVF
ncbi:acyl-CoA mutase large subunit family protein [Melioribacter sp. OK-6-Me]|uniref:acyl-CoA mutase large subunit family protein n=1 Tax=unclassified Melioribacter TaxID=2627329 RepID=UPI003EDA0027